MKKIIRTFLISLAVASSPLTAYACDYCSIYTQLQPRDLKSEALTLGVSVNLLGYSHTRLDGDSYQPGANQNHKTTIAEIEAGYDLDDHFGLQLQVPFVFQSSKRLVSDVFESSSDQGIGDVAIYGKLDLVEAKGSDSLFLLQLVAGAKLPTGDTEALSGNKDINLTNSGIYGSDLAMGTGSVDVPLGVLLLGTTGRITAGGGLQYTLRTEGDYGYQFADDIRWDSWIGHIFSLEGEATIEPRVHLNGISKDHDQRDGADVVNSGLSVINVGPEVVFHFANQVQFSVEVDAPVMSDNDGLQSMVDHRVLISLKGQI